MSAVDAALSLAPLTLAAVLVLSGVSKLRDTRASTLSMMRLLRLPRVVASSATARVLPYVELATAALLLTPWAPTFALGAALALGLFVAVLVRFSTLVDGPALVDRRGRDLQRGGSGDLDRVV